MMDGKTLKRIRHEAGLTVRDLAATLRVKDVRGIMRYEAGEQPVSGPVSVIAEMIDRGDFPADLVRRAEHYPSLIVERD